MTTCKASQIADLDPELKALVEAMNRLDGVTTTTSCHGHGKSCLYVWFRCDNMRSLGVICKARRLVAPAWSVEAWEGGESLLFVLTSNRPIATDLIPNRMAARMAPRK